MIKKATVLLSTILLLFSIPSFSSGFVQTGSAPQLRTLRDIEECLLPSVTNALILGDTANISYLDIAACEEYGKLGFKKWNHLKYDLFLMAYKGYLVMKKENYISNDRYLTVMDFELSSTQRRLWVLDLEKHKVVLHDLVSHGRNSGEEYAVSFSNKPESFKSSLGFYVTAEPYIGKNDYSLRLHGVEAGFNDNAFDRGIVMHGADYVSHRYIRGNNRLGRSQGCPAVSPKIARWLIDVIQGGSCLFIYYPDKKYLAQSEILNADDPAKELFLNTGYALNLP